VEEEGGEKESGSQLKRTPFLCSTHALVLVLQEESFTRKGSGMSRDVPCLLTADRRKKPTVSARV